MIVKPGLMPRVMMIVGMAVTRTGMMEMATKTKAIPLKIVLAIVMSMVVKIATAIRTGYR